MDGWMDSLMDIFRRNCVICGQSISRLVQSPFNGPQKLPTSHPSEAECCYGNRLITALTETYPSDVVYNLISSWEHMYQVNHDRFLLRLECKTQNLSSAPDRSLRKPVLGTTDQAVVVVPCLCI